MKKEIHASEIETTLLGELLNEPKMFDEVNTILNSDNFYDNRNANIFLLMSELNAEKNTFDEIMILEQAKKTDTAIDSSFLGTLRKGIYSSVNAVQHAKIILEKYMLRQLIATKKIYDNISDVSDPFEVLASFGEEIWKIENKIGQLQKDYNLREHYKELIEKIKAKYLGETPSGLMSSSFPSLNRATGGIMQSDYVIIYGLDKSAKSTLGYRLLLDFAFQKKNIGIFSLEMDFEQVGYKQTSMISGIEYLKMRNPRGNNLQPHELQDLENLNEKIKNLNIYIDDKTFDFNRAISKSKLWKRKYDIDIFFYDYIGLFESSDQAESVKYLLKSFSRRLKQLAKELNTPIILVSQANEKDKTADSIDLLRDCDYALRICKPVEVGIKSMKIDGGKEHQFNDTEFLVTVERSRHGKNRQNWVCGFRNENFVELNLNDDYNEYTI